MSEFRMLNVTDDWGVIEVLGGEEALEDWAWVGKNGSRQALYNKLRYGGWDVHGHVPGDQGPNRLLVRRLGP
jgi:hypothetical protein